MIFKDCLGNFQIDLAKTSSIPGTDRRYFTTTLCIMNSQTEHHKNANYGDNDQTGNDQNCHFDEQQVCSVQSSSLSSMKSTESPTCPSVDHASWTKKLLGQTGIEFYQNTLAVLAANEAFMKQENSSTIPTGYRNSLDLDFKQTDYLTEALGSRNSNDWNNSPHTDQSNTETTKEEKHSRKRNSYGISDILGVSNIETKDEKIPDDCHLANIKSGDEKYQIPSKLDSESMETRLARFYSLWWEAVHSLSPSLTAFGKNMGVIGANDHSMESNDTAPTKEMFNFFPPVPDTLSRQKEQVNVSTNDGNFLFPCLPINMNWFVSNSNLESHKANQSLTNKDDKSIYDIVHKKQNWNCDNILGAAAAAFNNLRSTTGCSLFPGTNLPVPTPSNIYDHMGFLNMSTVPDYRVTLPANTNIQPPTTNSNTQTAHIPATSLNFALSLPIQSPSNPINSLQSHNTIPNNMNANIWMRSNGEYCCLF